MTNENDEQRIKEKVYEFAKYNLEKSNLVDIATSYWAQSGIYGDKGAQIMVNNIYEPALDSGEVKYQDFESGKEIPLVGKSVADTLRNSRKNKQAFTGVISEQEIVQTANATIERSINYLKVEDIAKRLEMNVNNLKKEYKGKYVNELLPKKITKEETDNMLVKDLNKLNEKIKFYESLVEGYKNHLLNERMKKAIDASEKKDVKNLESILTEDKQGEN